MKGEPRTRLLLKCYPFSIVASQLRKQPSLARVAVVFVVCRAWRTSNRWKSGRGYLPPSVANRKLLVATPGGEEAV